MIEPVGRSQGMLLCHFGCHRCNFCMHAGVARKICIAEASLCRNIAANGMARQLHHSGWARFMVNPAAIGRRQWFGAHGRGENPMYGKYFGMAAAAALAWGMLAAEPIAAQTATPQSGAPCAVPGSGPRDGSGQGQGLRDGKGNGPRNGQGYGMKRGQARGLRDGSGKGQGMKQGRGQRLRDGSCISRGVQPGAAGGTAQ